jgi:hypothetical protein
MRMVLDGPAAREYSFLIVQEWLRHEHLPGLAVTHPTSTPPEGTMGEPVETILEVEFESPFTIVPCKARAATRATLAMLCTA